MWWVAEHTQARMIGSGKLHRYTKRDDAVVDFSLFLATAQVTVRTLIHHARNHLRLPGRPTARRRK